MQWAKPDGSTLNEPHGHCELAGAGHLNTAQYRGSKVAREFNPGTIKAMIEGPAPRSGGNSGPADREP